MSNSSSRTSVSPTNVLKMLEGRGEVCFADHVLDNFLTSTLVDGSGIHEFVGGAGAGKTQICLQAAAVAAMPTHAGGRGVKVFWLSTEGEYGYMPVTPISDTHHKPRQGSATRQ